MGIQNKENEKFDIVKNKVSRIVENAMKGSKADADTLDELLQNSEYYNQFLENISSEEKLSSQYEFLKNAYTQKKNNEKLIRKLKRSNRLRIVRLSSSIAASVAIAIFALSFLVFKNDNLNHPQYVNIEAPKTDVESPTLIVGDSSVVVLSADQDKIMAADYKTQEVNANTQQHLIIPNGRTYTVVLDDGTEVILNSASELTYPSTFARSPQREVKLKGEAFFKVSKSSKPFIVHSNDTYVKVYGTRFNVKSQEDGVVQTILVEGSVGVGAKDMKEVKIIPNQSAEINHSKKCVVAEVDPASLLGWIDGYFRYAQMDFESIVRDLASWYNVGFEYDSQKFKYLALTLSIQRENSIEKTINIIESSTNVKFIKTGEKKYAIERTK